MDILIKVYRGESRQYNCKKKNGLFPSLSGDE